MTRNPYVLFALARQGYSHGVIAEIAGVTPEAVRSLIGNGPYEAVCRRRTNDQCSDGGIRTRGASQ